jgi:hypothetical protein
VSSVRGLTELRLKVHVVNLWTLPAEALLAAGDVGLVPWVPLARYDGPPATLLQECRERIVQQGRPEEQDNLLAMTRVMAEVRYNDPQLLSLLGGSLMTIDKVLMQTPAFQRYLAEKTRQVAEETERRVAAETARKVAEETARETVRKDVGRVLHQRFGAVPADVAVSLQAIAEQARLEDLHDLAVVCPDLEAFRQALSRP